VSGIVRTPTNSLISVSNVYIPLSDAQTIASRSKSIPGYRYGDVNEIFLLAAPDDLEDTISKIKEAIPGATVTSAESFVRAVGGIAAQSRNLAVISSIVVLLASLVIVVKTVSGNIMERRGEIGIMKTVGWTSADISRQIIMETLIQSVIGGALGIAVGFLAALIMSGMSISIPISWDVDPFPHFMMTDSTQKTLDVGLLVHVSSELVCVALFISMAVGMASAFLTLKNVNHIRPSEVLRYE
jgi:putative ABC transport system permease protein